MESKFKIGDKVRFNSEWGSYRFEDSLSKGEVVEISDITDWGSIYVKKYVEAHVTDDEIELVSRPREDKKTAFLTELKELMERYNANLSPDVDCRLWLQLGKEYVVWDSVEIGKIDASNIFDFDK